MFIKNKTVIVHGLAAMLVIVAFMSGCQATTGMTAGQHVDDSAVTASVKSTLVADKAANLTRIEVDTNRGVVTLNGVVESGEQKARAEQLARRVDGVTGVNNNLQVR